MMNGRPCIRGMPLTAQRVLEALAAVGDVETLRAECPELELEDVEQVLRFAAAHLEDSGDA